MEKDNQDRVSCPVCDFFRWLWKKIDKKMEEKAKNKPCCCCRREKADDTQSGQ